MGLRAPQGEADVKSRVYAVRSGRYNHRAWSRHMSLYRRLVRPLPIIRTT